MSSKKFSSRKKFPQQMGSDSHHESQSERKSFQQKEKNVKAQRKKKILVARVECYKKLLPDFLVSGSFYGIKLGEKIAIPVRDHFPKLKEYYESGKALWREYATSGFFGEVRTNLFNSEASFTVTLDNKTISAGRFILLWEKIVIEHFTKNDS